MQIHVTADRYVNFNTKALAAGPERDKPDYVQFPESRGVYIFHLAPLSKNWLQKDKILYIGETNSQKLRGRIPINYRGKIRLLIEAYKFDISDVYISYCEIEDSDPISLSKLIERGLLYAYENQFKVLPPCNRE